MASILKTSSNGEVKDIENDSEELENEVLYQKQLLIQQGLDDIGMTNFQWKLFCLNGFGYAADSLLVVCQSISQSQVIMEFDRHDKLYGVSTASSVGLLVGAIIWGIGADVIGRKLAFNSSLFISAIFVIVAGAMPTFISFTAMVAIYSAGSGGNYILDSTNFLEFLPTSQAHLTTILAIWWGVGYTITGFLAWAFMSNYSCLSVETCTYHNNRGWRLLHYTSGGLVMVAAILRITVLKMPHTPRWLISQGRDEEAIAILQNLALKHNRELTITLEDLKSIGTIEPKYEKKGFSVKKITKHLKDAFATKKLIWSTSLLLLLWVLIGIANPLFGVFLPYYLKTRGYQDGDTASNFITWRDYAINNVCGLVGPLLAWPLLNTKFIKRRGTLAIGALITMAFLFGYTQIRTPNQNLALSAVISAVENIFFAALYGVTPELLPTSSRATVYGISVATNRVCNVMANIIAGYANVETTAPLFICAALFGMMSIVSVLLPFEPADHFTA